MENPGDLSWTGLEALGELKVYDRTPVEDNTEIIRRIGDADVSYTNKTLVNRETMEACSNLKFISVLATGYNVVDVDYARGKGIVVRNISTLRNRRGWPIHDSPASGNLSPYRASQQRG